MSQGRYDPPYSDGFAVTPSDVTVLVGIRALWVGGAGAVAVDFLNSGTGIVLSAVPAGTLIRGYFKRVKATGTTATLIVALS